MFVWIFYIFAKYLQTIMIIFTKFIKMRNFRNYEMWKVSIKLSTEVYKLVQKFPVYETYGLGGQLRRAVVSIASNIAEGAGRTSEKDFAHFLQISLGSAHEVETQLHIAHQLGYITQEKLNQLLVDITSIEKQLYEMIQRMTHPQKH